MSHRTVVAYSLSLLLAEQSNCVRFGSSSMLSLLPSLKQRIFTPVCSFCTLLRADSCTPASNVSDVYILPAQVVMQKLYAVHPVFFFLHIDHFQHFCSRHSDF